ncbi:MAG: superoxide dismutase [Candidatus Hydrothermarchaeota archaeon]|nr:superoxide dismutase [Candidatus Hydrothermarchaeota archaeon]
METAKFYILPKLPYEYKDLAPSISEEQLKVHHQKHHQAYVSGANAILEKLDKARKDGTDLDFKATLKELSFNIGGHLLHSLFWGNLAPAGKCCEKPTEILGDAIEKEFGSFERFKREFTQAAVSVEGSGWAALTFCKQTNRPIIMQIEKHNTNVYPMFRILMVLVACFKTPFNVTNGGEQHPHL